MWIYFIFFESLVIHQWGKRLQVQWRRRWYVPLLRFLHQSSSDKRGKSYRDMSLFELILMSTMDSHHTSDQYLIATGFVVATSESCHNSISFLQLELASQPSNRCHYLLLTMVIFLLLPILLITCNSIIAVIMSITCFIQPLPTDNADPDALINTFFASYMIFKPA